MVFVAHTEKQNSWKEKPDEEDGWVTAELGGINELSSLHTATVNDFYTPLSQSQPMILPR